MRKTTTLLLALAAFAIVLALPRLSAAGA